MLKSDLLTVKNATQTIYRKQDGPTSLHQFVWLEPITGLFHLQMNVLKFIFEKLLGGPNDRSTIGLYSSILKRKNIAKKMKNFHACDDFFRLLVEAHVIALAMNTAGCITIDFFAVWLS